MALTKSPPVSETPLEFTKSPLLSSRSKDPGTPKIEDIEAGEIDVSELPLQVEEAQIE